MPIPGTEPNGIVLIKRVNGKVLHATSFGLKDTSECKIHRWQLFENNRNLSKQCLICGLIQPMFEWISIPLTLKRLCIVIANLNINKITPQSVRIILDCSSSTAWSYYATTILIKQSLNGNNKEKRYIQPKTLKMIVTLFETFGIRKITWNDIKRVLKLSRTSARRYYIVFGFIQETLTSDPISITGKLNIINSIEFKPQTDEEYHRYIRFGERFNEDLKNVEKINIQKIIELKKILLKYEDKHLSSYFRKNPKPKLFSKRAVRMYNNYESQNNIQANKRHIINLLDAGHPLIKTLLFKGSKLIEFPKGSATFYLVGNTCGVKLRKMGNLLTAANARSKNKIDNLVMACYLLGLRDHNYFFNMERGIEKTKTERELLQKIDLLFLFSRECKEA